MNITWWFKQNRIMMIILLSGLMIHLLLISVWIIPNMIRVNSLERELNVLNEELLRLEGDPPSSSSDQNLTNSSDEANIQVLDHEESLRFTIDLNFIAENNNIQIQSLDYSHSQLLYKDQYYGQTVTLFINGTLSAISQFINELERLERVIHLLEWEFVQEKTEKNDQNQDESLYSEDNVQLHLKLRIYHV
ncbi:type 4a pilus biogenesis protein PilO [Chengkuizengella sp. SCS-71B]|uniref:type 4a pilus biogenesis protein PilO n=1 Tax=Chengkuizengella sp. SCS-71B TaxID=3115290 RepID=UPI0032C21486